MKLQKKTSKTLRFQPHPQFPKIVNRNTLLLIRSIVDSLSPNFETPPHLGFSSTCNPPPPQPPGMFSLQLFPFFSLYQPPFLFLLLILFLTCKILSFFTVYFFLILSIYLTMRCLFIFLSLFSSVDWRVLFWTRSLLGLLFRGSWVFGFGWLQSVTLLFLFLIYLLFAFVLYGNWISAFLLLV